MAKKTLIKSLIWIFLAGNLFFGSFGMVKDAIANIASPVCNNGQIDIDMQTIYEHQRSQGHYSTCINNGVYNPGEPIDIYVDLYNTGMPSCGNLVNWHWVEIRAITSGQTIDLIEPQWYGADPFVSGSGTIIAPNTPGSYEVVVDIVINIGDGIPDGIYREHIPYSVTGTSCVPDCTNEPNVCFGTPYDGGCGPLSCTGTKDCSGGPCVPDCTNEPNVCSGIQYDGGCGMGNPCLGIKAPTYTPTCVYTATGNACNTGNCQKTIDTEIAQCMDIPNNGCGSAQPSAGCTNCVNRMTTCPACPWHEGQP